MNYFVDSSMIINLLNKKTVENVEKKLKIKEFEDKLAIDDNDFFINRLVLIESLRIIDIKKTKIYKEARTTLEIFTQVEIKPEIYNEAIELSRFCKNKGITLKGKCEAIDFIHFITAKFYKLEILADDGDFIKLENIYAEFNN